MPRPQPARKCAWCFRAVDPLPAPLANDLCRHCETNPTVNRFGTDLDAANRYVRQLANLDEATGQLPLLSELA